MCGNLPGPLGWRAIARPLCGHYDGRREKLPTARYPRAKGALLVE